MPDSVLTDLAHEVLALSESPEHRRRRRLWADLHALRAPRPLVHYAMYNHVWEREIARPDGFHHQTGLARHLEVQLRARLWKAAHIPDDEPVLPTVWLWTPRAPGEDRLWGVALSSLRTEALGSYKPIPPIRDESDLDRLRPPRYEEDRGAARSLVEDANGLLGGLLPLKRHTDELHYGPFEWAVRLRGIDSLLLDVCDRPSFVHALMARIADGLVGYHRAREAAGAVDAEAGWAIHMLYDDVPPGLEQRLAGSWAYVHAQSAASLSPRMYAEFIQPYNARIAALFGKVYYHGCEDLSRKCAIIRGLPNLRLFHVGPWTPVAPVVEQLGNRFALEVHSHPTNVLFTCGRADIRRDLEERNAPAAGVPRVLKLCDVETVGGCADPLQLWAEEASAVAASSR